MAGEIVQELGKRPYLISVEEYLSAGKYPIVILKLARKKVNRKGRLNIVGRGLIFSIYRDKVLGNKKLE